MKTASGAHEFTPRDIAFLDNSILHTQPLMHLLPPDEVRLVRGAQCKTRAGLFNEFSAALQFPWYFGHNWDAFDECLHDVGEWMIEAKSLTVVISESSMLLTDEESESEFHVFARIMRRVVRFDAAESEWLGQNFAHFVPLSLVLIESADKIEGVSNRWTSSGP